MTLAVLVLFPREAGAHKPSDSYLRLRMQPDLVSGRWDVALRDLDGALDLDADGDGRITWGELSARRADVARFLSGRLSIDADEGTECPVALGELRVVDHSDGGYASFDLTARCASNAQPVRRVTVRYALFFDTDPLHRGIARIDDGAAVRSAIFSPGEATQSFVRAASRPVASFGAAVRLGVQHIFAGIDHLCFLLALLLPAVLVRRDGRPQPVTSLRPALAEVLRIVTAFTVAHSITLTFATLDWLRLPSRLVESGIAASVVLAAVNNLVPVLGKDRWAAAFALGLLHGFGFSAALMDLDLPRESLAWTLFGFNVGVEVGQLAIVAVFVPLAYLARRTVAYRRVGVAAGSLAIACVGAIWFAERALDLRLF